MSGGDGTTSSPAKGRSALDRETVLAAALRIVDEGGVDALTMRRVATVFAVDPMTIYRYVDGKDALLDGVVEQVWNEVRPVAEPEVAWDEALRGYADALRTALRAHPRAAPLLLTRPVMARASLQAFESLINLLRDGGFDDPEAARLVRAVTTVVMSDIASSHSFHAITEEATTDPADAWITLARALPADTPTNLVRTAALICDPHEAEADLAFLVDLVLAGAAGLRQRTGR